MARTDVTVKRSRVVRTDLNFFESINENIYENGPMFMMFLAGMIFIVPQFFELWILAWWFIYKKFTTAPFPELATDDKTKKQGSSSAVYCLGMEVNVKKPVWFSDTQMRQHLLVMGTTGAGKAQPTDAKVHTPNGWVRMGDIKPGMKVSTPDGKDAEVLGVYPQGKIPIFTLKFADGRETEACGNHLWEIHHKHWNGKYKKGESRAGKAKPRNLKTLELKELMDRNKGKFYVRLAEAVQKPQKDLPISPYVLGVLLGDGCLSGGFGKSLSFTSIDQEIIDRVDSELPYGTKLTRYESKEIQYHINTEEGKSGRNKDGSYKRNELKVFLNQLGLLETKSLTKFIPEIYLESSIEQRIALLQGLMDTDGTCDSRKTALSYCSISKKLAEDVATLVRSLGGIANICEKIPSYKDKNGNKKECNKAYNVHIRIKDPSIVFHLSRKKELTKFYQHSDNLKLEVVSIEQTGEKEAQCIYIDHPEHLYITDDYIVSHNTELLLYMATQAMAMGSGVIFVDGKGDVKTWFRLYSIARRLGVEEGLRVLNFGTNIGVGELKYTHSNTINPFTLGDAGQLKEMMSALMAEAGGDNAMWKGRAESMMGSLLTALCDLRDQGEIQLNASSISEFMILDKLAPFATDERVTDLARQEVKRYLDSLPGFNAGQQGRAEADKQHGFLTMQFTEILGLLNNTYTHIMAFPLGEINMLDVIINRRSLYVMLPSMEKSGNSVKNLGKIIVQQIRAALSKTLGAGIKGTKAEKLDARPTTSTTPMLCILDEYGSYAVEGFGEVAAQARSIGFSTCFAVQDWASLEKADSRGMEALRIWANTNIKIIMKVEDSKSTMPLVLERIKKGHVLQSSGKEYNRDSTFGGERAQATSSYNEIDRLDPQELFLLKNGAYFIIYENKFHKLQAPWLDNNKGAWKDLAFVAPARLVPCPPPSVSEIEQMITSSKKIGELQGKMDEPINLDAMEMSEQTKNLEECFKLILNDVGPYDEDDHARRGLIYVRNFLRGLLQMSANQARKETSFKTSSSQETSASAVQQKMQNATPGNVSWNNENPDIPDEVEDDLIDESSFTENEDDLPYDDSIDPECEEHPEDLNHSMPNPVTKEEYITTSKELVAETDSETGNYVKEKVIQGFLALNKFNNDEDDEDDEE